MQPSTSEQARLLRDMRLATALAQAHVAEQQQSAPACLKLRGFDDPQVAFSAKSTGQLLQSLAVFRTCSVKPLVQNADVLLAAAKRVVGPALVTSVVRHTFFKHFCGGEHVCLGCGCLLIKQTHRCTGGPPCSGGHNLVAAFQNMALSPWQQCYQDILHSPAMHTCMLCFQSYVHCLVASGILGWCACRLCCPPPCNMAHHSASPACDSALSHTGC